MQVESPGLETLASTFKTWPISYCSPGDSWTPATLLAMSRLGVKVFCNDRVQQSTYVPFWYCGMLVARYAFDFQSFYEDKNFKPGAFEEKFETLVKQMPQDGVIILYTHPTRMVTAAFWDEVFANGKRPKLPECPPAPLRKPDEIERIKTRCRGWLDWLCARKDVRMIDFAQLYKERSSGRRDLQVLLDEESLAPGCEGRLPLRNSGTEAYLPSSAFMSWKYQWIPYTPGFKGEKLIHQMSQLAWTAAPATKTPGSRAS
jgi:hypothetical protein